jgi:hypothetical protein
LEVRINGIINLTQDIEIFKAVTFQVLRPQQIVLGWGVMVPICNPSTHEAQVEGSQVEASPGSIARTCLKKREKKRKLPQVKMSWR